MAEPEYQQDSGAPNPDALPEGGASQVNDIPPGAPPSGPDMQDTGAPEQTPQFTNPGETEEPTWTPQTEAEKFLAEDPENPTTAHNIPGHTLGPSPAPPQDIHEWLPDLARAAADPRAPAQVKALFRNIMYHVEKHKAENS